MTNPAPFPAFALGLTLLASVGAHAQFYTDTGSPSNPPWSTIFPTLNNNSPDPGPVHGSVINVNNAATEVGLYGNRPISVGTQRIHVCCNTSTANFNDFKRWFQTDGNTQVFRLFVNDQNTASTRVGAARCEAFQIDKWKYTDGVTYEWTGRYTIARRQQGYAIFQVMNENNEWAMQLNITNSGGLLVNNRRNAGDVLIKNPDGTTKNFDGKGFDVRVIDDGKNYRCWIDGVLVADNHYDRPTGETNFRWGKYMGDNFLISPSTNSVILVSGAQVKSWRGRLDSAPTNIIKANNSIFLGNPASWTGGVLPGIHNAAVWNSTVTASNATTFNIGQTWGGIRITNPGGNVTINGDALLKLEGIGIDMSASTRSLAVNCPVEPNVTAPWVIASGHVATFNNTIRGYQGITLGGSGRLILNAANNYTGPTTINGGTLQLGNGGTTGALHTNSSISVAGGASFAVNRSDAVTQGTHFSGAPITGAGGLAKSGAGTLTMLATNTYTGPTTISAGTFRLGNGGTSGAISPGSSVEIASGAVFMVARSDSTVQGLGFSAAPITGAGGLTKAGSGTVILTAANAFTGPTRVDAGTLQLGDGGTAGSLSPGSAISVASGARLTVNRSDNVTQGIHFGSAAITGSGGLAKSGTGTLTLTASNSYAGPTTINSGTLQLGNGGTTGSISPGSTINVANGANFAANRSNSIIQGTDFSGAPITGGGGLEKSGTGTMTLTRANTYSGETKINGGILAFSHVSPFSNTSAITISDGAMLRPTLNGATINTPISLGTAGTTASISAPTNLPGAGVVSTLALAGAINGAGNVKFTSGANQNALSTILLNAMSTYGGHTMLDTDGTANTQIILKLGIANALPTSTVLEIDGQDGSGSGRLTELNLNGFDQQIAGLTNTPRNLRIQRIVNSDISDTATLTIINTADYAFSGSLGGSAIGSVSATVMPGSTDGNNIALIKDGTGNLSLTGSIGYSGRTAINHGTLTLGSANPNNENSTLTIAATGATMNLAFSGTDTVKELFIGNKLLPAGVYKAVGNPEAGIGIPQITGTGTLTVTTGSSPVAFGYEEWKTANGTDQSIDGDHDGDGVPNGIEHFLGGDGNTTGFTPLPVVMSDMGTLSITWTRGAKYDWSYNTHFVIETAKNFKGTWIIEPAHPELNATVTFPTADTLKYTFPSDGSRRKFVRLKVMEP